VAFIRKQTPDEQAATQWALQAMRRDRHLSRANAKLIVTGPFTHVDQFYQRDRGCHTYFFGKPTNEQPSRTEIDNILCGIDPWLQYCRIEAAAFKLERPWHCDLWSQIRDAHTITLNGYYTDNGVFVAVEWTIDPTPNDA
jgi:hypothetical protein